LAMHPFWTTHITGTDGVATTRLHSGCSVGAVVGASTACPATPPAAQSAASHIGFGSSIMAHTGSGFLLGSQTYASAHGRACELVDKNTLPNRTQQHPSSVHHLCSPPPSSSVSRTWSRSGECPKIDRGLERVTSHVEIHRLCTSLHHQGTRATKSETWAGPTHNRGRLWKQ
jgi:hypothetical protein